MLAEVRPEASAFGPHHQHGWSRDLGRKDVGGARTGIQTGDPATAPLSAPPARARFGTVATRRCSTAPAEALTTAGVTAAARSAGDHHAGHAGGLGRAEEGADVLRILQMIEDEDRPRRRQ